MILGVVMVGLGRSHAPWQLYAGAFRPRLAGVYDCDRDCNDALILVFTGDAGLREAGVERPRALAALTSRRRWRVSLTAWV
jgi:hypothetical protein